jgi:hypothetical protein
VRHSTQIHHLDLNQDGHMDLVVSDAGLDYHPWSGSRLALCYGHHGRFVDRSDLLPREIWTARSYALAAGVLNPEDGPVLLLPRQSSDAAHGIVRHSDGQLIFEPEWIDEPRKYLSFSECAALEDFDRDGHTDLYLGGNWSTPGNTLFWGTGKSTLHDSTTADLPPAPFGYTIWDDYQQSSDVYVQGGSVSPVAIIDVDSDGWLDIVTISERVHCYTSGRAPRKKNVWTNGPNAYLDEQVQILRNNRDRTFTDISHRTTGRNLGHVYVRCLVSIDINRDGHTDLIAPYTDKETYEFGTLILINDGTGRFDIIDAKAILGNACHVNRGNRRTEAGAFMPVKIERSGITAALISPVSGRRGSFGYQLSTVNSTGFLSTGPGLSDPAARGVAGFNESYYFDRYLDAHAAVRAGQYARCCHAGPLSPVPLAHRTAQRRRVVRYPVPVLRQQLQPAGSRRGAEQCRLKWGPGPSGTLNWSRRSGSAPSGSCGRPGIRNWTAPWR